METLEISHQLTFADQTSSWAASLASLIVSPGSEKARQMTATSGLNFYVLLEKCDPLGFLRRMFQASYHCISTRCYLTWKVKRTPAGRLIFQLSPSMPRTSESASLLWPTPTQDAANERKKKYVQGGTSLSCAVKMWPTPRANERGAYQYDRGDHTKPRATLTGAARMWPTMTAGSGATGKLRKKEAVIKSGGHKSRLEDAVAMWPTPTSNRRSGLQSHGKNAILGALNPAWVCWLMGFPLDWLDLDGCQNPQLEGLPQEYLV